MALLIYNIILISAIIAAIVVTRAAKTPKYPYTAYRIVSFHDKKLMSSTEPLSYSEAERLAEIIAVNSGYFPTDDDALEDWWLLYDIVTVTYKSRWDVETSSDAPEDRYGKSVQELLWTKAKYESMNYRPPKWHSAKSRFTC